MRAQVWVKGLPLQLATMSHLVWLLAQVELWAKLLVWRLQELELAQSPVWQLADWLHLHLV